MTATGFKLSALLISYTSRTCGSITAPAQQSHCKPCRAAVARVFCSSRLRRASPSWSLRGRCFPMRLAQMKGQANGAELVVAERAHLVVNGAQRTTAVVAVSTCGPATGIAGRILQMPHFDNFAVGGHLPSFRAGRCQVARVPARNRFAVTLALE